MSWRVIVKDSRGVSVLFHVKAETEEEAELKAWWMAPQFFVEDQRAGLELRHLEKVAA